MSAKKILILPLCLSVAGHLAILSLMAATGRQAVGETSAEVLTVDLKKIVENSRSKKEGKKRPAVPARWQSRKTAVNAPPESYDADTVDLGSTDSRYTPYLKQLKKRIEKLWMYPEVAYAKKEEGVTVVKFSVARNGSLDGINLMASSGSPLLDEGTLGAIRAAAPYEPLPAAFNISRLNIVAAFRYRLAD
jgi:periplasmic protein TonB